MRLLRYASHVSVVNLAQLVVILQNQMPVQSVPLENMHHNQDKLLHALIAHRGDPRHQKALQVAWGHYLDGLKVLKVIAARRRVRLIMFVQM